MSIGIREKRLFSWLGNKDLTAEIVAYQKNNAAVKFENGSGIQPPKPGHRSTLEIKKDAKGILRHLFKQDPEGGQCLCENKINGDRRPSTTAVAREIIEAKIKFLQTSRPDLLPLHPPVFRLFEEMWGKSRVDSNVPGVTCPKRTVMSAIMKNGTKNEEVEFHANRIRFMREPLKIVANEHKKRDLAFVGQSPQRFDLCERFLVNGLDHRQGIFQFASENFCKSSKNNPEHTLISQLEQQYKAASDSGQPLVLGGRYQVTGLEIGNDNVADKTGATLTATKLDTGEEVTIQITQANLRFNDNLFRCAEIERADALMSGHVAIEDGSKSQFDPVVVSYAGIGRSAVLVSYRQALSRFNELKSEAEIGTLVDEIVAEGRRARGPHFVHSARQLDELKQAVQKAYTRQANNVSRAIPSRTFIDDSNLTPSFDRAAVAQLPKKVKQKNRRVHFEPGYAHHFAVIRGNAFEEDEQKVDEQRTDEQRANEQRANEQIVNEQRVNEQRADKQRADEQRADEQIADEQRADEQIADEQRADEQRADEQRADEQRADEQRADEQRADEQRADEQRADEQ